MSKPLLTLLLWVAGVASAGGASVSHGGTTLEGAIEGVEKLSDARAEPKVRRNDVKLRFMIVLWLDM
eukprot:1209446-Amorphochlora_amoeboformis.AAC.1